ncbi:MAG: nucleoside-diphosphate kinase [Candidatus Tectomicrobia bacterium]|nr:nucleoside-diphosphate kinase [Candidatus Tectomicrobia bacterium]
MERTLAIIKPDAVAAGVVGKILSRVEAAGFTIRALKLVHLSKRQAEGFYQVHRERPFFQDLTTFMSSGPAVPLLLERENAIAAWRELMGATNPAQAAEGTLRKEFATDIEKNAVHGSDSPATAAYEIAFFFSALDVCPRD